MGRLNKKQRQYIVGSFGRRASFNKTERKLYGHGIAEIPSLIKRLIVISGVTEIELRKQDKTLEAGDSGA